jgi:hypothetical protein
MEKEEIQELKEQLLEIDPCIEFLDEHEDKLVGYAERFGCHFIPLYKGVNTFFEKNPEEAERKANEISNKKVFPMPQMNRGIIGYVTFEQGDEVYAALLYDKEDYLDKLAKDYEEDGMEIDEDDSFYSQALQWYEHNDLGYGLSGLVTPAFACDTDEYPIDTTN